MDTENFIVESRRVYWQPGQPKGARHIAEVQDTPCGGWQNALFVVKENRALILCPYSLKSYDVSLHSQEYARSIPMPVRSDFLIDLLLCRWALHERHSLPADFERAAWFIKLLGGEPPEVKQPLVSKPEVQAGKEATTTLLKPLKEGSRRAAVYEYLKDGTKKVATLCKDMEISRSNALSQLFVLRRDHGIGYIINNDDTITFTIPSSSN